MAKKTKAKLDPCAAKDKEKRIWKVKLLLDKKKEKVVWADVNKDFVDMLFGLMALPLGNIVRLLEKKNGENLTPLGCINNLYQSVREMCEGNFSSKVSRQLILNPRYLKENHCKRLKLDDSEYPKFFGCPNIESVSCRKLYSNFSSCECECGKLMSEEMDLSPLNAGDLFTSKRNSFLITDNMNVLFPGSLVLGTKKLVGLGYKSFGELDVKSVDVGHEEFLSLFRCLFTSETPLTDLFLKKGMPTLPPSVQHGGNAVASSHASITPTPTPPVEPIVATNPSAVAANRRSNIVYTSNQRNNILFTTSAQIRGDDPTTEAVETQPVKVKPVEAVSLSVYVNKQDRKVLYAEVGHDFVDLLILFLAIPLESVLEITKSNTKHLGCINSLADSIKRLSSTADSHMLPVHYSFHKSLLGITYEMKQSTDNLVVVHGGCEYTFTYRPHTTLTELVQKEDKYIISNDLCIKSVDSSSTTSIMKDQNLTFDDTELLEINISKAHAIDLLRASLMSSTPLTTVLESFLKPKA